MTTPRRSERGLDRLVNFSDATVAIAITLLVLPLVDVAREISDGSLASLLSEYSGTFIAFGVSFAVIGRFWMNHHRMFEDVVDYTYHLAWANMLWLASIVFLPFSANVLSNSPSGHPEINALYIGTMVVTSISTVWMQAILFARPELVADPSVSARRLRRGVSALVALVLALVLAVLVPSVGLFWLFLLALDGTVERLVSARIDRRRAARTE